MTSLVNLALPIGVLGWFNILLALAGALVAFKSINLMREVTTHVDVMSTIVMKRRSGEKWWAAVLEGLRSAETMALGCAFITLTAGLVGQVMGALLGKWQAPFDTILFAGLLALLVANRRVPAVQMYKAPVSLTITGFAWGVFFISVT
jgi:hypothetical protein